MQSAIQGQATWTIAELKTLDDKYISDDLSSLTPEQKANLSAYMSNNMPSVSDVMSKDFVVNWFTTSFNTGVQHLYQAIGQPDPSFAVKSAYYKAQIQNRADYLLNKSSLDQTTKDQLIDLIAKDKEAGMTRAEIAKHISDVFPDIAASRADLIAQTETARMVGQAQYEAMKQTGVMTKAWVNYGVDPCPTCMANAGQDYIPMDAMFDSGDLTTPGHPRCECALDFSQVDFSSLALWDGE